MRTFQKATVTLAALSALALTAACGGDAASDDASGQASASAPADVEAGLVGPGCAGYLDSVPEGPGSVAAMAQDPVAVAVGTNRLLTMLTKAISGQMNSEVNLVDTLNSGQYTVFAPVDEAFLKLPNRTMNQLAKPKNAGTLNDILTYHVLQGRIDPADIEGEHATLNGATLTVSGSDDTITVNDTAAVVCGGVQTANATVYLVDSVLMPPSA